ncbi:hypothetical protein IFR05_009227 [Cadophora sp. M221]|nr:hypothetical protein IFR05_009227 [Cadophora sp. M221]
MSANNTHQPRLRDRLKGMFSPSTSPGASPESIITGRTASDKNHGVLDMEQIAGQTRMGANLSNDSSLSVASEPNIYTRMITLQDDAGKYFNVVAQYDTGASSNFIGASTLSKIGDIKQRPIPPNAIRNYVSPILSPDMAPKRYVMVKISDPTLEIEDPSVRLKIVEGVPETGFGIILGRRFMHKHNKGGSLLARIERDGDNDARLHHSNVKQTPSTPSNPPWTPAPEVSRWLPGSIAFVPSPGPEESSKGEQNTRELTWEYTSVDNDELHFVDESQTQAHKAMHQNSNKDWEEAGSDDAEPFPDDGASSTGTSSLASSVFSLVSHGTSTDEGAEGSDIVAELATLLLKDEDLAALFSDAFESSTSSSERFENNFRRLLKVFSEELKKEATCPLHHQAVSFIRKRAGAIATNIRIAIGVDNDGQLLEQWKESEDSRQARLNQRIHDWNHGVSAPDELDAAGQKQAKGQTFDDEGDLDDDLSDELASLTQVVTFLTSSEAFRKLRQDVHDFVHPPTRKKDEKSSAPNEDGSFQPVVTAEETTTSLGSATPLGQSEDVSMTSTEEISQTQIRSILCRGKDVNFKTVPGALVPRPGIIDTAKAMVEKNLAHPVIWWPLQPTKYPCPVDKTRMSWTCGCGRELHADVSPQIAEEYENICRPLKCAGPSTNLPLLPMYTTQSSSSSAGASPPVPTATSLQTNPSQVQQQANSQGTIVNPGGNVQNATATPNSDKLFIHWCIDISRTEVQNLFHIRVQHLRDMTVIPRLKEYYRQSKGYRNWFSLTDCCGVKFVLFIRNHLTDDIVKCLGEGLPKKNDPDYSYSRSGPCEDFLLQLEGLLSHSFHNASNCSEEFIETILSRIPKKTKAKLGMGMEKKGYGMRAISGWAVWKLITALVLTHLGPLIFAIYWLRFNPGQLSDAFTPALYAAVLFDALFGIFVVLPDIQSMPK